MKVLLLAGGNSAEREVSLNSGKAVFDALRRLGHDISALDPATGNNLLDSKGNYQIPAFTTEKESGKITTADSTTLISLLQSNQFNDIDVVFIALHGGMGEDGSLQGLLDLAEKKYTGSGRVASTVAMDKALSKQLAVSVNVPTPQWQLFRIASSSELPAIAGEILRKFDLPFIIKPNNGGSTIGLTLVQSNDRIQNALETALSESSAILVERYIAGREMTVAVLDGEAFPVVEIKPVDGLYDYEAKYTSGKSQYFVPAEIGSGIAEELQKSALAIYDIVGADGLARIDFILDKQNQYYFLELNTLPGMTTLSLAPMAAKADGIEFDQLIQRLLESALKK